MLENDASLILNQLHFENPEEVTNLLKKEKEEILKHEKSIAEQVSDRGSP